MARSQDGITAPFSDPVYLKAAVLDPAFSLLWVEPHVLVNRDIKAEVAQQVKELILQDAAETEQPVLLGDEEDLGEGEGLFGAYRKRQKKDVGTSPALQLSHYLDIADGESALLFWALNMKTLPSLYRVAIRVLASGRALTYCRMDRNVPILRLWFDVELELIRDFRLNGVVGALGPGGEEVDGPARVAGIGVGGAVSAVVEDGSGSSMGGSTMASP
uniref:Uncharacterized protein n=1 Tax=Knipowitschia caucasica TaxID=637954 RepID=A0AAV2LK92_KNICA